MSSDELENYEAATELTLFKEYRDVFAMFKYAVETDQRFYLCNSVEVETKLTPAGQTYFEVVVDDAWIWDNHRPARFIRNARLMTFKDVQVEELAQLLELLLSRLLTILVLIYFHSKPFLLLCLNSVFHSILMQQVLHQLC